MARYVAERCIGSQGWCIWDNVADDQVSDHWYDDRFVGARRTAIRVAGMLNQFDKESRERPRPNSLGPAAAGLHAGGVRGEEAHP